MKIKNVLIMVLGCMGNKEYMIIGNSCYDYPGPNMEFKDLKELALLQGLLSLILANNIKSARLLATDQDIKFERIHSD